MNKANEALDMMAENARELGLTYEPAQQEPFGYFKAMPFGWTDCAETDEGAIALYERPQPAQPSKPLTDEQILDAYMKAPVDIDCHVSDLHKFARAIEAAHGIKENT